MLDDQVHDLVRARPDGDEPHVAQQSLDRIHARVADAAHDLHRVVDDEIVRALRADDESLLPVEDVRVALAPKKSEPPRGSVNASATVILPASTGFSQRSFCSAVPNTLIASPTMLGRL